jgi:hypothetical protein
MVDVLSEIDSIPSDLKDKLSSIAKVSEMFIDDERDKITNARFISMV